jgi:hypothetical protein
MTREELSTAARLAGMEHVLTNQRLDGFFSPRDSPRGVVQNDKANWRYVTQVRTSPFTLSLFLTTT